MVVVSRMQQRRDTAANWAAADPVLLAGELGYETDTGRIKVGNGIDPWADSGYLNTTQQSAEKAVNDALADPGLALWGAALAKRATRRANAVLLGASLSEGYPATTYAQTLGQQLVALLRLRHPTAGVAGGRGFVGIPTKGVVLNTPWTLVGGARDPDGIGTPEAFHAGPGRNCWYTNGSGTATYLCAAGSTAIDLQHVKGTAGHATAGQYKINGGAAVPFSTANGTTLAANLRITVPSGASVEFSCTGTGYLIIAGVQEHAGDETAGIQVHNAGHCGYTAEAWAADPTTVGGWRDALALLNPDLIIIPDLGPNDMNALGANPRTSGEFLNDLWGLIDIIRAGPAPLPTVEFQVVVPYDTSAGITGVEPWEGYHQAYFAATIAAGVTRPVDLTRLMPATSNDPADIYDADLVHGKADGSAYELMARHIVTAISP